MLATWHFHVEVSSKCTLRCPRCARQEVPQGLVNTELDLTFFQRNFSSEFILDHVSKITFCGDDGDPIYAGDLIPIVRYIKSVRDVEIVIVTNGSYKKPSWWTELGALLTNKDTVHFSIDGWDNASNNLYRVNSNFDSILSGVTHLRAASQCRMVWAAIMFKFNEDRVDHITGLARAHGFDAVQITRSTKFGTVYPSYGLDDPLEPSKKFVSSSHRFERDVIMLSQRGLATTPNVTNVRLFKAAAVRNGVRPLCEIGNKGLYINAQGRLFPCCWVANRYSHNAEWQQLAQQFDLHKRTLTDVLHDPFWNTEFQKFHWQECQTKCAALTVDEKYATEW